MLSPTTVSTALRVSGDLDVAALAQVVDLTVTDLSDRPDSVDAALRAARHAPWPDPTVTARVVVLRVAADNHVLLLCTNGASPTNGEADEFVELVRAVVGHRAVPYRPDTFPSLIETAVTRHGTAVAVSAPGGDLTYDELNRRANRLAHLLIARGVGPGDTVTLALPRSVDIVIAQLATLKSGAAFVPVDPDYPADRIAFMLADSDPILVLTTDHIAAELPVDHVLALDAPGTVAALAHHPDHNPTDADRTRPLHLADVAYMIYTSGSTGRPKGVLVPHTGIANFARAEIEHFRVRPGHRVLQFASPSFDASILELCLALPAGATLVVPPPGPLVGADLARVLADQRVTHALIPPVALATIPESTELPGFHTVIVGGDACDAELVRQWAPGRTLINAYGPTEITVVATWSDPLTPGPDAPPIGHPIKNTDVHVLDDRMRPTSTGELFVTSPGLARGYHNQPGLTAARFVANPYGPPGSRMYATGDVVHQDETGQLHYQGRTDHQVKIRGHRVEPGEIETVLCRHDTVASAVVVPRAHNGHQRLIAYVVPRTGREVDPAVLRDHVAAALPDYLVPAAIMPLSALPLSPNGKLDRDQLPAPVIATATDNLPTTDTERTLAGVWADVLGVDGIGVSDDFFHLGGDSVLAARLLARIHATFGITLSGRAVFDHPTIAAQAELLTGGAPAESDPIRPVATDRPLPLSAAQRRLWFLDNLTGGTEYNTGVGLRLTGPVDVDALRTALAMLTGRHAALRTTFQDVDGTGRQLVAEHAEMPLIEVDLPGATDAVVDDVLAEHLRRPFDLRRTPPTLAVLVRIAAHDHVLLLAQHHIITDGASMRILVDELAECYTAALRQEQPGLPTPAVQYPDFAVWQHERPVPADDLAYWRDKLAGIEPLALPTDRPRPHVRTINGAVHRTDLPADLVATLTRLGRQHGATLFMTLTAAVQVLFARYARQSDVAVGTVVAGRDRDELANVVGFFVDTVVLRSTVDHKRPFQEFLGDVRETVLGAFAHGGVPFDRLVEDLRPERDPSRTPLIQTLVVLHQDMVRTRSIGGLHVAEHDLPRPAARFDLVVEFLPRDGGLHLALEYNTDLFDPGTIARLAEHLRVLLAAVATGSDRPIAELSMLTESETHQLLVAWNDTEQHVPPSVLPDLFQAQATRTPAAPAVYDADGHPLSYAALDELANRLARLLVARGAGPNGFVALALPRTPSLIVAILAVWKAGAAYLPIDPGYPADRITFMLSDTAPALALTTTALADRLPDTVSTLVLDDPATGAALCRLSGAELTDADRSAPLTPDHPAYVIYTSGSTGRPKGVVVAHQPVVDLAAWAAAEFGAAGLARVVASTSLNFDVSVFEIVCPLLAGGSVEIVRDLLALAERPASLPRPSLISGVPSAFAQLLAQHALTTSADTVVLAGEALPAHLVRDITTTMPGARVANIYGPTEACVYATAWYSNGHDPDQAPPIGRPITNTRAYVLDPAMRPVPVGVPGELCLGGPDLARGYHNRPGLTAEKFVADPYGPAGARMYRTGDVVRWTTDGEIEYLGRSDHQVKVRGFRIELGEVESALLRHESVDEAVAVVRTDAGHKRLVAYVVGAVDPAELRTALAHALPDHMVPSAIVVLDGLPLNPNGKLDRGALPAPDWAAGSSDYTAPRTDAERIIAGIWSDVLGLPRVGVEDNFFELGGDSILGIQVVAAAARAGLRLAGRDVFLHQTVASLAAAATPIVAEAPDQAPVTGDVPLTPIQRWLFGLQERPERFEQTITIELPDDVDDATLRTALNTLLAHHDALRMRFERTEAGWRQYNAPVADADVLSTSECDLATGPLLRAELSGRTLRLTIHHLVVDGVSWQILLDDLDKTLRGVELAPKTTSFRDWAITLAEHDFGDDDGYWQAIRPEPLPADHDGPNTVAATEEISVRLTADETRSLLRDVPGAYRTQVNDLLLAALGRAITGWTGRDRVVIDLEGHGREDIAPGIDLSRTVGWFTTMFPVALDLSTPDWDTTIKSVKEQLRAIPHRGIGFGAATTSQLRFNYLGQSAELSGLALLADPDAERSHVLDVAARIDVDELVFTWWYSPNRHDDTTVLGLANTTVTALREIIEHCRDNSGRTPSDFPLARLDQAGVDRLAGPDVADILPLTPTQTGMVFHRLSQADQAVYFQQITFTLDGVPDPTALARAWQQVVDRTPVLRSSIVWDGVDEPLRIVHTHATVPVTYLDSPDITDYLAEDRAAGIDLAAAPLMRVAIARRSDTEVVVVWTFHHVLLDGWSLFGVLSDVLAVLDGDQPAVRGPFRDYLRWLSTQDQSAAQAYWQAMLDGVEDTTPLPFDRPPLAAHRVESRATVRTALNTDVSDRVRALAHRNGLTTSTVVQGAFALLLSRYSGRSEVVFGTTVSGRPPELPGVESMIGLFITTVPARVRIAGNVVEWLRDLQARQAESRRFDFAPPRRSGLFDSILVVENYPTTDLRVRDLRGIESTNYPLAVVAYPGEQIEFGFGYDPHLFDESTISRLADHLLILLDELTMADRPVVTVPMLTPAQRHQVLAQWNDTTTAVPEGTIPELFARQVARTPDATALVTDHAALTYAELDRRANRLAHRLVELGVRPEVPVALLVERSVELVVAELAISKAGGVYVPLDARAPVARLRLLITETGADVLVTDQVWATTAGEIRHGGPVVVLDAFDDERVEHDSCPAVAPHPDNLAYVVHTSGSTGTPKGVGARHRDVVTFAFDRAFTGGGHDVVLLHSPQAFDASTYELWVPLLNGGRVVLAPPGDIDTDVLRRMIAEHGVTGIFLTSGLFRMVAAEAPDCLRGAREVWTGGEIVPAAGIRQVLAACPGLTVADVYGPTETTTYATHHPMRTVDEVPDMVPIGGPLDNMRTYVLDAALMPNPPGVPGELYIAGAGLARGYLRRPGLTAERFVADPYGPPGDRMYATGDVVRWTENGELEFIGRRDEQVKIRGFRIELSEIETVLLRHADVAETVVVVRLDETGRKRLIAYVVPAAGPLDPAALREFLGATLPDYMVPSVFHRLDALPLNPNGKVDRNALPTPVWQPDDGRVAPRTETEAALAAIWAELLGVDRIGVTDDFFEHGGDSILSIQVASRARRAGLHVSPRDVFEHTTIATLAATVTPTDTPDVSQEPVVGPVPLTPIQRWFFDAEPNHPDHFHQSVTVELADDPDPDALRRALATVIAHHDALRMRFELIDGEWRQENAPVGPVDTGAEIDLAHGPLLRAELSGRTLRLIAHHLVVDGVSWRILLEDIATAYQGGELGPKTTSFRDWAIRLAEHDFGDETAYWRAVTDGVDPTFPVDCHGGPNTVGTMRAITVPLDTATTRALLRDVPPVYRTRINDVLLTALAHVLSAWTGRDRVLVDLEGHGREHIIDGVDLSRTVGWFTTMFPVALPATRTWADGLKAVKEQLRAVPNHGIGFGAATTSMVSFNYLGQFDSDDGPFRMIGGLDGDAAPDTPRAHAIDIVAGTERDQLSFTWYYSGEAYRDETICRLADELRDAVVSIVTHCARPDAGGRTPSDYPLARLDQSTVDLLAGDGRDVEDIYPLTPMQAGMVFHTIADGGAAYHNQVQLRVTGVTDPQRFGAAWQRVVDRTPALRTSIVWDGVAEPVQVVRRTARVDITYDAPRPDRGFDLTEAPLMRLHITTLSDDEILLVWTFHHVLLDGWSAAAVFGEVCAEYTGAGEPVARRPFRDYLAWLRDQDPAPAEDHWRGTLAGCTHTPLPFDHPAGEPSRPGETVRVTLPSAPLRAVARHNGLTLNTIVQCAWALLLARYSGQRDVVFGTTVSGRPADLAGVESMIGLFINTVPTRVTVPDTQNLVAWLRDVQRAQAESRRFDHVSLAQLSRWADLPGGVDLFDSIVVFENYPFDEADLGLGVRQVRDIQPTNYPLSVVVEPGDELSIGIDFDAARFDAATVRTLADHLAALLTDMATDTDRPVGDIAPHTEHVAVPVSTNHIPNGTLVELFAAQVRRSPDTTAVVSDQGCLTYAELDGRANQLAHRLLDLGLRPEQPVGILMDRSPDVVVAELAVVKAGGAYLPLDVRAPHDRLRQMLAGAAILITDETWSRVDVHSGPTVVMDDTRAIRVDSPHVSLRPGNLAYVMFTSGSTGTPKGVAVRHQDVVALAFDQCFAAHTRTLLHSPLAFDATTYELWVPLLRGGQVVVAPPGDVDIDTLRRMITQHGVSTLWLTAGLFRVVAQDAPDCLAGVRELWTGGDVVPAASVRRVLAACPGLTVVDGYGPTETTTFATHYAMTSEPVPDPIPIGRPLDTTRTYVLDHRMRPVPARATGELYLAGDGLARGYLDRPGLTAERFLPDPFSDGDRMYATGDVVRRSANGELEFVGRADDQVKIRGFRIEPGEIETVLAAYPGVTEAVVIATRNPTRLVAYVVGAVDRAMLRAHVSAALPDYMVPAAFVVLDRLPLSANGKVDRAALPVPAFDAPRTDFVPPRTPAEHTLSAIWADVLGVPHVGVRDNFFELGGDSILSIQVVSRARQAGLALLPRDVFRNPTVAELAATTTEVTTTTIDQGPVTGPVPLTPIQRWYFRVNPDEPAHFDQSIELDLVPDVDRARLFGAIETLIAHHDALRMRFTHVDGEWRQHCAPLLPPSHPGAPIEPFEPRGEYDLADGPLLRAELVGDTTLRLSIHHLVVDGVSWRILLEDLDKAYRGVELDAKTTSYRDWAVALAGHDFGAEADFWRAITDDVPDIPVDIDGPDSLAATASITVALSEAETDALLRDVPAAYRTQVNDVLLAALGRVLATWTGRDRVVVDLEGHGREHIVDGIDLSRTVGWFTTMYPVALAVSDDWGDTLKAVKEQLRAVPNNGIGFGADNVAPVSFNYLGRFDESAHGLFRSVGPLDSDISPRAARPHLVDVVSVVERGALMFTWSYSANVHHGATIAGLADRLRAALREIIEHCRESSGRTPSDFPLARLDQAGVDRLVGDGRDVADVYPLTPMQAGMVFHGLSQADHGVYFEQVSFVLDGVTDPAALHAAWQHVVDRTPMLRSRMAWQDVPEPLQVVHEHVTLPVTHLDWTDLPAVERAAAWEALRARDRAAGIDLSVAPLMRVTIARLSATEVQVLWTFHHVLLDGWSVFAVLADVCAAHAGSPLPERRPFRDYLRWLADQDPVAAEQHWRSALRGFDTPSPLPYDHRPAHAHATRSASWRPVALSRPESDRLYEFARRHSLTVNTLVQGAWTLALSRYAGRPDVCFGATVAGRPAELPGADAITGIFINTLPVRAQVPDGARVVDWLLECQAAQAESRRFDYVALGDIARWSDVPAGSNLFESLVVVENYPIDEHAAAEQGLRLRDLRADETTNYPLSIVVTPHDRLLVEFGYDPELFEPATIERLTSHFTHTLAALTTAPTLAEIDVLPDTERQRIATWNTTERAIVPLTLPELIESQVARTPDATAVRCPDGELTYARLNERANRLAHHLIARGAGPGHVVALQLGRSVHLVVAALAVAKSGAAFLPVDPDYPADRIAFMLADSDPTVVLTAAELDTVDLDGQPCHNPTDADRIRPLRLANTAYVIYTSGSTGQPKGVLVPHTGIANFATAEIEHFGVRPGDRVLQFASPSFDASVLELCLALPSGATLVVPPPGPLVGQTLADVLVAHRVTHALIPPAALSTLPPCDLPDFRTLIVGGDACTADLVARWAPGRTLINAYGPTEVTIVATWSDPLVPHPEPPPIGRPITNTRIHVLDAEFRPVPIGVPGEVYVSSPGLAHGYHNRPGLTASRFVAAPGGQRMYATGDLAHWDGDGRLHYRGRTDHQVKIRGYRIEPAEIEATLRRHERVTDAVVVPREDGPGNRRLIGYVVGTADPAELTGFLRQWLPDHMIPAAIVRLDALPLSPNGKLDRTKLPEPTITGHEGHTPPTTETEQALAAIWAEVLGTKNIGVDDDFFQLGGDSVRSVLITARAKAAFDVTITPKDVLTAGTIGALAELVEEQILRELEQLAAGTTDGEQR